MYVNDWEKLSSQPKHSVNVSHLAHLKLHDVLISPNGLWAHISISMDFLSFTGIHPIKQASVSMALIESLPL